MTKHDDFRTYYNSLSPERQKRLVARLSVDNWKRFEIRMFGSLKTAKEKEMIVKAEAIKVIGMIDRLTNEIIETIISSLLKNEGVKGALKYLAENKHDFELLLPKEELNAIYLECRKK